MTNVECRMTNDGIASLSQYQMFIIACLLFSAATATRRPQSTIERIHRLKKTGCKYKPFPQLYTCSFDIAGLHRRAQLTRQKSYRRQPFIEIA
ncbi:hypothetical protein D1AOALGA4SA_2320 [Olavius algarvensis Delta 1 endosymbiont]|nr:hypothetical protein D1AOALGA4SA_2320 [Olavius algarvensis Delta 1 endosymbiont]